MHVVRLLAPIIDGEDHTKDIDFSPTGIRARSAAGYVDTSRVITMAPWEGEFDPMEGVILHEARAGMVISSWLMHWTPLRRSRGAEERAGFDAADEYLDHSQGAASLLYCLCRLLLCCLKPHMKAMPCSRAE